jgi:hypothetical protein
MRDDFDVRLPKRQIDRAYEILDEIDAMEDLSVEECVILAVSLHSLANTIEQAVHDYAVRGYYAEKEDHVQGQIDHYRTLLKMERGEIDLGELGKDDGEATA